jgi:hypothetical protein
MASDLKHEMRRTAEAGKPESLAIREARELQRSIADGPSTQKWGGFWV